MATATAAERTPYRTGGRHRYWSCVRKCGYLTAERAQRHADSINAADSTARVAVYSCRYCGRLHIGTVPSDRQVRQRWYEQWAELGERAARCLREENRGEDVTRVWFIRYRTRSALKQAARHLAETRPRPRRVLP